MAILINEKTRFIVQGSSDQGDAFSSVNLPFYASSIVAYVSHDGADLVDGNRWLFGATAIFPSAAEAVAATRANASIVRSAPDHAAAAVEAAIDAGISLIIVISEIDSTEDRERIRRKAASHGARVIGPCSPGVITPGACQVGTMPGYIHSPGRVGILSRSGTRTHEAALQTSAVGLGQSTVVALGRTPVVASSFVECFELFLDDPQTDGIVLLGDAHGRVEEDIADLLRGRRGGKPVVAHIEPDQSSGSRLGQAEDVWSISDAMAARKTEALRRAGVIVTDMPAQIGQIMRSVLEVKAAGAPANRSKRDFTTAMRQVEQVCYDAGRAGRAPDEDFVSAMRQVELHCYDVR